MSERWVGFVIVGDVVTIADADIPDDSDEPITIVSDDTWRLQKGDRAEAYQVMHRRCANYLKENDIARVVVKASALTMGATKLGHLTSAELRGVIIAASASAATVSTVAKSHVSRTYGDKNMKMDDYIDDDSFWQKHTVGVPLRKASREAAMFVIAQRNSC